MKAPLRTCAILAAIGSVSCSASPLAPAARPVDSFRVTTLGSTPIKHVIVVVQENRSFDNFFSGYPKADSATSGRNYDGSIIPLRPITFAAASLNHGYQVAIDGYDNGKMDGFGLYPPAQVGSYVPSRFYMFSYVQRSLIEPYWDMARRYVLADKMFSSQWGASFTAHQMLFAGTTEVSPGVVEVETPSQQPWDCNAPTGTVTDLLTVQNKKLKLLQFQGPFPCFSYGSIADLLDAANVSWKYYMPYSSDTNPPSQWDAPAAIRKIRYGPDYPKIIFKPAQVIADAQSGNLPGVSWVIPDYLNADYVNDGSDTGPSWVSAVVNAVGEGPDWKSSAIVVVWDDWGGWYDHVPPPQVNFYGLGFRSPCLIISPYAKTNYVSHTVYSFGSILKTTEQIFGLGSLGTTDVPANSMLDSFDFTQAPRPFKPINAKYSRRYFMNQKPSNRPNDDE